jgi:hypothetical protein
MHIFHAASMNWMHELYLNYEFVSWTSNRYHSDTLGGGTREVKFPAVCRVLGEVIARMDAKGRSGARSLRPATVANT